MYSYSCHDVPLFPLSLPSPMPDSLFYLSSLSEHCEHVVFNNRVEGGGRTLWFQYLYLFLLWIHSCALQDHGRVVWVVWMVGVHTIKLVASCCTACVHRAYNVCYVYHVCTMCVLCIQCVHTVLHYAYNVCTMSHHIAYMLYVFLCTHVYNKRRV